MNLLNKRCLVTAAGQGIGRETALRFAEEGATVIAVDINGQALEALADCSKNICTQIVDVTNPDEIQNLFESSPSFDVIFNCVGYVASGTILECTPDDWFKSTNINVNSMYYICRAALPSMIENGGGSIINMSSIASSIKGVPNRFAYSTTKAAVIGLTKSIATDYVAHGIRCNAICPGTVASPSLERRLADTGDYEKAKAEFIARQPMGRIGNPKEIAALTTYLASSESSFTTGTINIIDGGWTN